MTPTDTWPAAGAVQQLWPTQIYQHTTDTTHLTALAEQILAREADDTSRSLGVAHARKSAPDLLSWDLPAVVALQNWIAEATYAITGAAPTTPVTAHAWAVHYRDGGFHELHAHHDSAVSGVYYLAASTEKTGALEVCDPRPAHLAHAAATGNGTSAVHAIHPHPGLLIAFPSWLRHQVAPHHGDAPRICVAFNASLTPTELP